MKMDSKAESVLLYGIVFLVGAAVMAFEILTSRLVAPYFGSSVYVWGNLIGVVLCAMALGYALGGRLAEKHARSLFLAHALLLSGMLLTATPLISHWVGDLILRWNLSPQYGSLLAFLFLCLVPACAMTTVFPLAAHYTAGSQSSVGEITGRLGLISTLGSLSGTFFTTFVLVNIEWLGSRRSLLLCGLTIFGCGIVLFAFRIKKFGWLIWFIFACASIEMVLLYSSWSRLLPPLMKGETLLQNHESPYHDVRVVEVDVLSPAGKKRRARLMRFADPLADQSGIYVSEPGEPSTNYCYDFFFMAWAMNPDIRRIAILGGGGGTVARDFLRFFPREDKPALTVDVVDIDPDVFRVGEEYLGYPIRDPRQKRHLSDARVFLQTSQGKYDLIILNAYSSGSQIPEHLITEEYFLEVRRHLSPHGIAALNLLLSNQPPEPKSPREYSPKLLALLKTYHRVFRPDRVFVFSTAKLQADWMNSQVVDYGGVVVLGVEGEGQLTPELEKVQSRVPRFTSSTGMGLDAMTIAMIWPSIPQEAEAAYQSAPILRDDFNPINLYVR